MTRLYRFWYWATRGRLYDELWQKHNGLMLQLRQANHDLAHVKADRDELFRTTQMRLRRIWQLEAEKLRIIDCNKRLLANVSELQGELFIHRSEALVRDAERIVKEES